MADMTIFITTITFGDEVVKFLERLNRVQQFFDGSLVSIEGVVRPVHRVMLALHSQQLQKEFEAATKIQLDVSTVTLDLVLQLIYAGKVSVDLGEGAEVMDFLKKYGIGNWRETNESMSVDQTHHPTPVRSAGVTYSDFHGYLNEDLQSTSRDVVVQENGAAAQVSSPNDDINNRSADGDRSSDEEEAADDDGHNPVEAASSSDEEDAADDDDSQVESDSVVESDSDVEPVNQGPTSALSILEALVAIEEDPKWWKGKPYSLRYWVAVILFRNRKPDEITREEMVTNYGLSTSMVRDYLSKDPVEKNFLVRGRPATTADDIIEYLSRPGVVPTPKNRSTHSLRYWVVIMILKFWKFERQVNLICKMTKTKKSKIRGLDSSVTPASKNFDAVEDGRRNN